MGYGSIFSSIIVILIFGSVVSSLPNRNGKILDGVEARDGDVPYMAALLGPLMTPCSSAIISDTWITSTASCCVNVSPESGLVYYGSVLLSGNGINATIDQIFNHPGFNASMFSDDLCLIKLKTKIDFSDNVQPIKLPANSDILPDGTEVSTAGWGDVFVTSTYEGSDQLFTLSKIFVLTKEMCNAVGPNDYYGTGCAFPANNAGACNGDFGSPITNNGTIYGVINAIQYLCGQGYPMFFTNIPLYLDWINSIIQENS